MDSHFAKMPQLKNANFKKYGGRGISVCNRWKNSFENFYADMGPRPTINHSIDRINNNGNYEPSNCRWATSIQQPENRTISASVVFNGEKISISRLSKMHGLKYSFLYQRIKIAGRDVESAVSLKKYAHIKRSTEFK